MDEIEEMARARKMLADEYGCDMCELTDSEVRAARVALRVAASDAQWINHPQTIEAKRQWDDLAKALGADGDSPDAVFAEAELTAGTLQRMNDLLDRIAVIVKGPNQPGTAWGWEDLPEKVEALVLAPQAPPAAEPVYPSAFNMGIARAGDWVIELSVGCNRVCDERYAAGWNACREKALEATGAAFAARYRWLRDQGGCPFAETDAAWDDPNALDEAIDKARGAI